MGASERVTLADVAAAAGVSVSTASLAFSGAGPVAAATRERVMAAAAELGYSGPNPMARSLRRGRSGIIGVVVGSALSRAFSDPVATQTLDGVAQELEARGLGLLLIATDQFTDAPALIREGPMDAAIIAGLAATDDPVVEALRAREIPVLRGDAGPDDGAGVGIEDRAGMAELARHLLDLGHERIGVISLPLGHHHRTALLDPDRVPSTTFTPSRNRWAGLRDAGLRPCAVAEVAGPRVEDGIAAGRLLLDADPRPTAVLAFSDLLAAGAVIAARERGLVVPDDLSVAGFDGLDLPWLAPDRLTTAAQPLVEKGRLTARAAAMLAEGGEAFVEVLPVTVRLGTTTGPAPG